MSLRHCGERQAGVWRDLDLYWDDHVVLRPPVARRLAIERANQRALRHALDAASPDVVSIWHMGAMSLGLLTRMATRSPPSYNCRRRRAGEVCGRQLVRS